MPSIHVPGLGTLKKSFFGPWKTQLGPTRIELASPDLAPRALQILDTNYEAAWTQADADFTYQDGAILTRLKIQPKESLAIHAVPWDEEHEWALRLDPAGAVREVVISPGP